MTNAILNSVIYSFLGIAILVVAFFLLEIMTPKHNLRKEILENKNMALALPGRFDLKALALRISEVSERYGLPLNPWRTVHAGSNETVEIDSTSIAPQKRFWVFVR